MPRKKAIIVCYAGVATAMLIKEKIEQNFGHKIEVIKTCSQQEVSQELIDQVDLVLTTAELSEEQKNEISHRGKALRAMKEKLAKENL